MWALAFLIVALILFILAAIPVGNGRLVDHIEHGAALTPKTAQP